MTVSALIVAAGSGSRFGGEIPKQYRLLGGRSAIAWSVEALQGAGLEQIVCVIAPEHEDHFRAATCGCPAVEFVYGGNTRTASVRAGLAALRDADTVLIHDAARPGVTTEVVERLLAALAAGAEGAAPALPVADSLRRTDARGQVIADVEREGLMRVQTPQAFRATALRSAYAEMPEDKSQTDDLAVVRAHGGVCVLVEGDARLTKLTYPEDFAMLETMLAPKFVCVGHGVDAHRFGEGDHVTLCGVQIPHNKGLLGHSDADAGWHALVDAILGALGEGDIGAHFPPSDPRWKGAESERFLRHAADLGAKAGARILHVDVTLLCEKPKIGPHREAMRARTAEVLGLPLTRVSVKATTTERMGFLGREEGLAAQATATLERPA